MVTPDEHYWAECAEGRLTIQRCQACASWQFPPTTRCNHCLSTDLAWQMPSGRGTLWSWIRMHKEYLREFPLKPPYIVAMVKLDEGIRMISSVADVQGKADCGAPVEVYFGDRRDSGGRRLPLFRLVRR